MKRVAMIILLLAVAITMRAGEPVVEKMYLGNDILSFYKYSNGDKISALEDITTNATTLLVMAPDGKSGKVTIFHPKTGKIKFAKHFKVRRETSFSKEGTYIADYVLHTDMSHDIHVYVNLNSPGSIKLTFLDK